MFSFSFKLAAWYGGKKGGGRTKIHGLRLKKLSLIYDAERNLDTSLEMIKDQSKFEVHSMVEQVESRWIYNTSSVVDVSSEMNE